jgi:hypothetical protein
MKSGLAASRSQTLPFLALTAGSMFTGAAIAKAPKIAWMVAALVATVAFLELPPVFLVVCGVAAATVSRVAVYFGLPSFLNFVHFPLILGGATLAWLSPERSRTLGRTIGRGLLAFLLVCLISWLLNTGEVLRPLFDWLVFMEPFLAIYTLVMAPPPLRFRNRYWIFVGALAALQFPFGIWQFITLGWSDVVQGTFIGQGAGAHIAGGCALLGVLIAIGVAVYETSFGKKAALLSGAALLFVIPVLGDAKQAILAFVPAFLVTLAGASKFKLTRLVVPTLVGCSFLFAAFELYQPLQLILNGKLISQGVSGKTAGVITLARFLTKTPTGWLFGIGPGNSVSRVALLTSGGMVSSDSPLSSLGLRVSPTTDELIRTTDTNYVYSSSSAFSTQGSWQGLIGDVGPIGLAVYVMLGWTIWRTIRGATGWRPVVAQSAIVMSVLLGGIYSWLEEPGFTLLVAFILGLTIIDSSGEGESCAS